MVNFNKNKRLCLTEAQIREAFCLNSEQISDLISARSEQITYDDCVEIVCNIMEHYTEILHESRQIDRILVIVKCSYLIGFADALRIMQEIENEATEQLFAGHYS